MTSTFNNNIYQYAARGDYAEGLNVIEKYLEKSKLSESQKTKVLFWRAHFLVQNSIIIFSPPFTPLTDETYQSLNFEKALSIIQNLESLNLTIGILTQIKLLKIKILRNLNQENERINLFQMLAKEIDTNKSDFSRKEQALFLREKAMHLVTIGEFKVAIGTLKKSIDLSLEIKEYENATETMFSLVSLFYNFYPSVNFTETDLTYFNKILVILQDRPNYPFLGFIFVNLLEIFFIHNKFNIARLMQSHFNNLLQNPEIKLVSSVHNRYLMFSGHLLSLEGSYEEAIKVFEDQLALYGEKIPIGMYGHIQAYIGHNHLLNLNFQCSFNHLSQGIKISRETNDGRLEAWIIYYFILLSLELGDLEKVKQFSKRMKILQEINKPTPLTKTLYNLCEASLLKNSSRLRDKMIALQIFEEVINSDKPTMPDFFYYAVLNHIELLFLEFKSSNDLKILKLIKDKLLHLERFLEETQSITTEVNLVIFKSRILFFELRFEDSLNELNKIKSKVKKLKKRDLIQILIKEEVFLKTEISKLEELISLKREPKIGEMIKLSHLDDLLDVIVRYRYSHNQVEVTDYLTTALSLIQNDI